MRLDYETLNRKIVVQQENPRRRDSEAWTRYEGYKSATTLQGFLGAAGFAPTSRTISSAGSSRSTRKTTGGNLSDSCHQLTARPRVECLTRRT